MSKRSGPALGGSGEWILNTIKQNPEGLLLLAAGAVLMMRTNVSQSNAAQSTSAAYSRDSHTTGAPSATHAAETVADTARQTMDAASSYASSASDAARQTMDAAKSYASSASEYADQARRAVGEQSERVVRQTRSVAQGILQNQPLAIALAGLAAGAALAAALPPTDLEKQTLGPMGDQMSRTAERVGDQLKQATMKAGEKLKSAAEDRGLHTEGLKEVASEVADTFKATMKGEQPAGTRGQVPSAEGPGGSSDRSW
jgi:hypothetical protein